jgi:hypothetical protein
MSPATAARCVWEVTAGIIPGTVDAEYTRRFGLTSDDWDGGGGAGFELFVKVGAEATAYVLYLQLLCSMGRSVNWTRIDFVWF